MQYRRMGRSGLKLSEVAVGSWMTDLKGREACDTAKEVLRRAYDSGVNFFDCADAYSGGQAEVFLGNILKEFRRSSYVVSSKVFFPVGDGPNDRGLSRKHIVEQLNRSLKNLQVDYLDLYFCHRFDPETCMEETLETLSDMVAQGKNSVLRGQRMEPGSDYQGARPDSEARLPALVCDSASVQYGGPVY